jgi:hypothetical protein
MSRQRTWNGPAFGPMVWTWRPMKPEASRSSSKSAQGMPLTHDRMRWPWATIRYRFHSPTLKAARASGLSAKSSSHRVRRPSSQKLPENPFD